MHSETKAIRRNLAVAQTALVTIQGALAEAQAQLEKLEAGTKSKPEKEALLFDPGWFKNQTNRHLTDEGVAYLRALKTEHGLTAQQAADRMGIQKSRVIARWKEAGLI